MPVDAGRSWFRYHQMFAGLLQLLELRRTAPDEVTGLHLAAAGWFAGNGYPVEAIRHAQAARDWGLAARLLADYSGPGATSMGRPPPSTSCSPGSPPPCCRRTPSSR